MNLKHMLSSVRQIFVGHNASWTDLAQRREALERSISSISSFDQSTCETNSGRVLARASRLPKMSSMLTRSEAMI